MNKQPITLASSVTWLEDSITTVSGPVLAISSIIAGVDVVTNNALAESLTWIGFVWAYALMLSLDFQVLSLGVKAHRVYASNKSRNRKICEIALAVLIALALAYVSVQMHAIFARVNSAGVTIDAAQTQLGINPIALIYERSALVLLLIFMSGWLRNTASEHLTEQQTPTIPELVNSSVNSAIRSAISEQNTVHQQRIEQLDALYQQRLQVVFEQFTRVWVGVEQDVPATEHPKQLPERTANSEQMGVFAPPEEVFADQGSDTKKEQVRAYLLAHPQASITDIANSTNTSRSYVSTVRSQVFGEQQRGE